MTGLVYKLTAFVVPGIGIAWLVWASGIDLLVKSNFNF